MKNERSDCPCGFEIVPGLSFMGCVFTGGSCDESTPSGSSTTTTTTTTTTTKPTTTSVATETPIADPMPPGVPDIFLPEIINDGEVRDLSSGTCWSGNWTLWLNEDDPSDGYETETVTYYKHHNQLNCNDVTAIDGRVVDKIVNASQTTDNVWVNMFEGIVCDSSDNNGKECDDYEVRFCCEGCCPLINVVGEVEPNGYYEDYPGEYELTPMSFNGLPVYSNVLYSQI